MNKKQTPPGKWLQAMRLAVRKPKAEKKHEMQGLTLRQLAEENPVRFKAIYERAVYFARLRMNRPMVGGNSPGDFVVLAIESNLDTSMPNGPLNLISMAAAREICVRRQREDEAIDFSFTSTTLGVR